MQKVKIYLPSEQAEAAERRINEMRVYIRWNM